MEGNAALKVLRILRRSGKKTVSDVELRRMAGLNQTELDYAAEELESEGMLMVARTYTLAED